MAFTYFFRDLHTLELIAHHLVPYVAGRSKIRIWDAGCAMGQEPYSLAIILAEKMGHFAYRNLFIQATDIDGSNRFADIITKGEYPEEELQRIPRDYYAKYFCQSPQKGVSQLAEVIRKRLVFQKHDLLSLKPIGDGFSLVLCKNVLLHFQPAERVAVIKMFHAALAPGGYFATEQTQKLPEELKGYFEQVSADAQVFRKLEVQRKIGTAAC